MVLQHILLPKDPAQRLDQTLYAIRPERKDLADRDDLDPAHRGAGSYTGGLTLVTSSAGS